MDNNEIRKQMELEQKRAFCKQSCTKIDQGLGRLGLRSGERAIWELFQNARDLAQTDVNGKKTAHIKITLTPTEFIFAHQGQPFDHDSLTSLVMQVSSQGKENDDTVGQYGTGFLTTHVFGCKLYVTGSLDMGKYTPNTFADINRFVIDRTYNNITEFVDKVAHQLLAVNDYADAPKTSVCRQWTQLSYDLSSMEDATNKATSAIESSIDVIPYVMTINKPIVDVVLENQLTNDFFRFGKEQLPDEEGLKVMLVTVDHNNIRSVRKIYYLESEDGEDIAILPFETPHKAKSLKGIAKLFVFFPLLGTEEFGMDVIFHSKKFFPVEERDGLHLPESNSLVRAKYEQNIRVLGNLTKMVQSYYHEHARNIQGWVDIARLTFDCEHHKEDVTKEFFQNYKETWSSFYQKLPIIDLNGSRVNVDDSTVRFFSPGIVIDIDGEEDEYITDFSALYNSAKQICQLVERDEIIAWSKVVASWNLTHSSLIGVDEIADRIGLLESLPLDTLFAFDEYLAKKELVSLFDTNKLIPNRDGIKMHRTNLRDASTIPVWLGQVAKTLVQDKTAMFADDSFVGLVNITPFTRNDLRDAITSQLRILRQGFLDKGEMYGIQTVESLLKLSSIFPSETSFAVRRKTISIIEGHLCLECESHILPPLDSNERDIAELPFKHLVECMLIDISQKGPEWMNANIDYVISLHSELSTWAEYYNRNNHDGLCVKYGAYPNCNGKPCFTKELKNGIEIPVELLSLYNDVMSEDLNDRLVDARFKSFYDFDKLTAKDVACEIETSLEDNGFCDAAVLDIINNIAKDSVWSQWFPHIAAQKAELFLNHVHEDCKESVFKLMKINDPNKLNQLAELADEVDLDEIIEKGRTAIIAQKNKEADFNFKLELGKYVEDMIRHHLSDSFDDDSITVVPEQYGADLSVCKNGIPKYYIEVKSRWGIDQSVMMSPLQLQKSVEEADHYALCCVDMSHLGISNDNEHKYPMLQETILFIKTLPNIGLLNQEVATIARGSNNRLVHIGGDYKCIVPQSTICSDMGKSLSALVDIITSKIQEN